MLLKSFAVIGLIIAVMFLSATDGWGQNLLADPGFESLPPGLSYSEGTYFWSSWRYFSVNGAGGTMQAIGPGYEGNAAIQLSRTNISGDSGLDHDYPGLRIPAAPGKLYRASVWAKSDIGSSLALTVAPYDSSGNWLGVQGVQVFPLSTDYRNCSMDYFTPAGTAYVNYALRVHQTGTIVVDACQLAQVLDDPIPTVTYPVSEQVDSFRPIIAFASSPHSAYQAVIADSQEVIWDSGTVSSTCYTLKCPVNLQPDSSYQVKVRIQNEAGWTEFSPQSQFTTPASPIVRITAPKEADALRGPNVVIKWQAEAQGSITSQSISIDGGAPVTVASTLRSYTLMGISEGLHQVSVNATSQGTTAGATSRFYVNITPTPTGTIYYYDMTFINAYDLSVLSQARMNYDVCLAVAALQGIVNRGGPRLFVRSMAEDDDTWWNTMRETNNWLSEKTVVTLPSGLDGLASLFNTFRADYNGAVLWDQNVPSTSNVASTVAGADNLIPIRYDPAAGSVYSMFVSAGPRIPVQVDLVDKFTGTGVIWGSSMPSTGSRKNDAYIWARMNYLESGKSNPNILMYTIDAYWEHGPFVMWGPGHTNTARDFIIQNKGFVFDLSPWGDEVPNDDPGQPLGTDLSTFRSILGAAAARATGMIDAIGFPPFTEKYCDLQGGFHDAVATEFETAKWLSYYNAYMDGDAPGWVDMANASIYSLFPLPDRLPQNRKLSHTDLRKIGYIDAGNRVSKLNFLSFYMGDYDSAIWLTRVMRSRWDYPGRGNLPLTWAFNPNLINRVPAVYEYYNRTRTDNDTFIAGDSGAGYVNPSRLLGNRLSDLPSAEDIWVRHNLDYFRRTGVKLSGFLINGTAGSLGSDVDEIYSRFSPEGVFSWPYWYPQGDHIANGMPALIMQQYVVGYDSVTDVNTIQPLGIKGAAKFLNYRTALVAPNYVNQLCSDISARDASIPWAVVDMRTHAALAGCNLGVIPDCRATYTFDTIPDTLYIGQRMAVSVGAVNEGWNTWRATGSEAVGLLIQLKQGTGVVSQSAIPIPRDVASGEGVVLDFEMGAPLVPGAYTVLYTMTKGGIGFDMLGDYSWTSTVTVTSPPGGGTPSGVKAYPDGTEVAVLNAVVTAGTDQLSYTFYIEDKDRRSGIQVYTYPNVISVCEGDLVSVAGILSSYFTERRITNPTLILRVPGTALEPIGMGGMSVGGGPANFFTPGIVRRTGPHNTGLLIRTWGKVKSVDTVNKSFYIEDGSGVRNGSGPTGLFVRCGGLASGNVIALPSVGDYVAVTGISSRTTISGAYVPVMRPRKQEDILRVIY